MTKYPRAVGFDKNGIAVCAGNCVAVDDRVVTQKVMQLPSDHYDFVGYDVNGKTEAQILAETRLDEIPRPVRDALRELNYTEEEMVQMEPKEMFRRYCQWEGLQGSYNAVLWDIVTRLNTLKL